jgi:type II secretory pathway predicted ATPase ExeA
MDYEQFFGLKDTPFRLTPDPDYYFPSEVHKEALQTLLYSIRAHEGFIQITGDPGTGKTLTLRTLLKHLGDEVNTALILNPRLSPHEILKVILEDLGLSPLKMEEKDKEELLRFFRDILLEKAKNNVTTVLIIDEAQNLPNDTLEELRLLSNLETEKKKLLQIILVGQVELEDKLKSQDLKQLNQRITIRYRLLPLSKTDTIAYIHHRLRIAGGENSARFSKRVLNEVYKVSRGVPRLINIICERALMAAFVDGKNVIEKNHFTKAMKSIVGEKRKGGSTVRSTSTGGKAVPYLLALLLLVACLAVYQQYFRPLIPPTTPTMAPQVQSDPASVPQNKVTEETKPVTATVTGQPSAVEKSPEPQTVTQTAPEVPVPPQEAFLIPNNRYFVSINRQNGMAYLWQGDQPAAVLKAEFQWKDPPPDGLYVLGENINNQKFFFNYPQFFMWEQGVPAVEAWQEVSDLLSTNVVPVISHSPEKTVDPALLDRAREVRKTVKDWADAWRNKDLDGLMSFYDNRFSSYFDDNSEPSVYTKNDLNRVKKDVFLRSGAISVNLSAPLCLLDPADPDTVMAVFYQKYVSQVYTDDGTQALYFKIVEGNDGHKAWKIVAKLWVPLVGSVD